MARPSSALGVTRSSVPGWAGFTTPGSDTVCALRSGVKRAAVPEECAAVSRSHGRGGVVARAASQHFEVTVPQIPLGGNVLMCRGLTWWADNPPPQFWGCGSPL